MDGGVDLGIAGAYRDRWRMRLNYTMFLGPEGTSLDRNDFLSFQQALKDRNYLSLSLSAML